MLQSRIVRCMFLPLLVLLSFSLVWSLAPNYIRYSWLYQFTYGVSSYDAYFYDETKDCDLTSIPVGKKGLRCEHGVRVAPRTLTP
jgi:hypothetical protein